MEALTRQRGVLKRKLTTFTNFLNDVQKKIDAGQALDNITLTIIQTRLSDTQDLLEKFDTIQFQIDAENEDDLCQRDEFETNFYQAQALAKCMLNVNISCGAGSRPVSPANLNTNSSIGSHSNQNQSIKLPTIKLPKFSGKSENWLEFRDLFVSLIDKNDQLDGIQKFHYLRASLESDAAQIIKAIDFCSDNYDVAWEALKERYNSTRVLVHNHVKSLFQLEPVQKESSSRLRQILDSVSKHLRSIKGLTSPETLGETLIIYLITSKLDTVTLREWEQTIKGNDLPSFEDLKSFLKDRADLLETLESKQNNKNPEKNKSVSKSFVVANQVTCPLCKHSHSIWSCNEFLKLSVEDRKEYVKSLKLCILCLKRGHYIGNCNSKYACSKCKKRHNILLHEEAKNDPPAESQSIAAFSSNIAQVLLPTASVKVVSFDGRVQTARALLDSGAQSNFITVDFCNRLRLKTEEVNTTILGIGNATSKINKKCKVEVHSHHNNFKLNVSCLVIPKITGTLPGFKINLEKLKIPNGHKLADPLFHKPGSIDILIGCDHFWNLLCIGQIALGPGLPTLQKSRLGWLVAGPIPANPPTNVHCNFAQFEDIQNQLAKFWELEQNAEPRSLSIEEKACEEHYVNTTKRDENGRFVVSIPFKKSVEHLGDSREQAEKRFLALERKFQRNEILRDRYVKFMSDYENLNHMSVVTPEPGEISFYLPHHGVLKEESVSTKLRVVFDGSASTTSGYSLNDLQMVGATIQPDLFSVLLKFRQGYYGISADVEKMYRMVLVNPAQRSLQRILWRSKPEEPIRDYNLNTVTYGTASGSFLAIRSLTQVGIDCENSHPDVAKIIKNNFYVDDLLVSTDSLNQARHICRTLSEILITGCFKLRKWICNDPAVLSNIDEADKHPSLLEFGSHENTKTLGLIWASKTDSLIFSISESSHQRVTKRIVLSEISQIFDPLGLLSACTITAKILLQDLWRAKLEWDESLPNAMHDRWCSFRKQLSSLNNLKFPRHVMCPNPKRIEVHGFSDASTSAYGACIYIRSIDEKGQVFVNLLCAKSKVAPVKHTTIPRLELCGALALSRLANRVRKGLDVKFNACTFWCDSTIVLGWLKTPPNLLKTFVCNRVAEIQESTQHDAWRHVPTNFNPADLLSRGVTPNELLKSNVWFHGPPWLSEDSSCWPISGFNSPKLPDLKIIETSVFVSSNISTFDFSRYSDLNKLERIVAYCLRFKNNCLEPKDNRRIGPVMPDEIYNSLICLAKIAQFDTFGKELGQLKQGKTIIQSQNHIQGLSPFIDQNGLIRVGGRLANSGYKFDKRHPILLSGKHKLTKMIFAREHLRLLHAGPQLLLASVRERFWALSGRNVAKQTVHQCIRCFRASPKFIAPIMGNLPISRVQPAPPFYTTGLDYAGPLNIKDRKGRGSKTIKCYICIFICFATKAVHLELVTSLTTESFLLSLRRFVSRRGKPLHLYSDNATNFIGAKSELAELERFFKTNKEHVIESMANEGIVWHFIPPRSPHFGGLWESGVRSCKHHLKRVAGNALLTFEEMYSLLTQVEAILNSRPLTPLSSDPNDLNPLTPAHFLVGRTLSSVPDPSVLDIPESRLSHFQKIQQLHQHYWKRWSKEYVAELQQRTQWKNHHGNLQVGQLVLIKEDNLPPLMWKLGRVIEVHPGRDGISRVATLKTSSGNVKRAFPKICPLPTGDAHSVVSNISVNSSLFEC